MINKLKTIFKRDKRENEEQTNKQQTRFKPINENDKRNKRITEMLAEYCHKFPQI